MEKTRCGCLVLVFSIAARGLSAAETGPGDRTPNGEAYQSSTVLLRMAKNWREPAPKGGGTIWRYFETWRPDVVRASDGRLVRVEPYFGFRKNHEAPDALTPELAIQALKNTGSEFPAKGWQQPDFDDGAWQRHPGPLMTPYRSLALVCVRGKFEVRDPARITKLALELTVQGGAIAYMNGKEVGRVGLPAGEIASETPAGDYPPETDDGGKAFGNGLIDQTYLGLNSLRYVAGFEDADRILRNAKGTDEEKKALADRYRQRFRKLEVNVPGAFLRKGVNVLAVEVHRAPAHPIMFTAQGASYHPANICSFSWNRCAIDHVALSAAGDAGAAVPNVARPERFQVWNASIWKNLHPMHYGDPNETLRPVRMFGLRNGAYSGQVAVGSPKPIKGLQAAVTDLKGADGGVIPASAIEVGYPQWTASARKKGLFGQLEQHAHPEIAETAATLGSPAYPGAFQPIWITVQVPHDAKPGEYSGKMTISAQGEQAVDVPVALRVLGGWTLPDPKDLTTFVGAIQCPDSVAMQYRVPLWSEAHWKYLEKTFELMGRIGVRDLHIPLLAKTTLGNAESMVRWIRQEDGTYKYDFSIAEKYLDLARRHLGLKFVVLWIADRPFSRGGGPYLAAGELQTIPINADTTIMPCTEFDPATGETKELRAPQWGTPEARVFWKPIIDGMRGVLAKRGLEKTALFGAGVNGRLGLKCAADTAALAPDIPWYTREHGGRSLTIGGKDHPRPVAYTSMGHQGNLEVYWDPDEEEHYGWLSDSPHLATSSSWQMDEGAEHATFRLFAESTMLSSPRQGPSKLGSAGPRIHAPFRGISTQGVDYWPLFDSAGPVKGKKESFLKRYTEQGGVDSSLTQHWMVGAGVDGPSATCRLHLMREALQEAEVRVFVQNALLEDGLKAKIGPDLAKRCKETCDERTRILRYCSWHWVFLKVDNIPGYDAFFDEEAWLRNSETLYLLAGEVAKRLEDRGNER